MKRILQRIKGAWGWRYPRYRNYLVSRASLIIATLLGLPGARFGWFGIKVSKMCKKAGHSDLAYGLSINPVSSVRYFEFDFARRVLPWKISGRCLDVSSPRLFSAYVLKTSPDAKIDIINPDSSDLAETRNLLESMKIDKANYKLHNIYADGLPWTDETFDFIWTISVIEHIPEPDDMVALKNIWRTLKCGGFLVLTFPVMRQHCNEYRSANCYELSRQSDPSECGVFFQRYYDLDTLRYRVERCLINGSQFKQEIYGENISGWFKDYENNIIGKGSSIACNDPYNMRRHIKSFRSLEAVQGCGISCMVWRKMN